MTTRLLIASLSIVLFIACSVAATRYPGPATSKIAATGSPQGPFTVAARVVASGGAVPTPPPVRSRVRRNHPHPSLDWNALALCESSGNWQDTAGYFQGGIQFAPGTWASFHGTDFAPSADLATRRQQIIVGERVLRRQGLAAWPACTRKLGWR